MVTKPANVTSHPEAGRRRDVCTLTGLHCEHSVLVGVPSPLLGSRLVGRSTGCVVPGPDAEMSVCTPPRWCLV